MPIFRDSQQLEDVLRGLFSRIAEHDASASSVVAQSGLVMRLRIKSPSAQVVINGRRNPVQIEYGGNQLRPDLEVELSADAFHYIMVDQLPLRKAIGSGQMKLSGPIWKSFVMQEIFLKGRDLYPQVLKEVGIDY